MIELDDGNWIEEEALDEAAGELNRLSLGIDGVGGRIADREVRRSLRSAQSSLKSAFDRLRLIRERSHARRAA